jgi:hypothetical protein
VYSSVHVRRADVVLRDNDESVTQAIEYRLTTDVRIVSDAPADGAADMPSLIVNHPRRRLDLGNDFA